MPTYDYKCLACGHRWEMFQSMKDAPVKACPACGKKKAERQFGIGAAVMFKGTGFYQTDYRSESYKQGAEADKKSASPPEKSGTPSATPATPVPPTPSTPAAPTPKPSAGKKPTKP